MLFWCFHCWLWTSKCWNKDAELPKIYFTYTNILIPIKMFETVDTTWKVSVFRVFQDRIFPHSDWTRTWKVSVFGVFLVHIFPHSDWIRRDTPYLSVFSPYTGKLGPEKLRIRTLFTQWVGFTHHWYHTINPFQLNVELYTETSHLTCNANQMTGFYSKCKLDWNGLITFLLSQNQSLLKTLRPKTSDIPGNCISLNTRGEI